MLAALGALGSLAGGAGGQGSMDTSSSAISGNTIGGINLGNQQPIRNMPDWLASRISNKPQLIDNTPSLNTMLAIGGGLLIGFLIVRRLV